MLIESVSGQSYGDYLAEAVFRPAALKATAYAPGPPPADAASGYHPDHDERLLQTHTEFNLSAGFAAGGIVSRTLAFSMRRAPSMCSPRSRADAVGTGRPIAKVAARVLVNS